MICEDIKDLLANIKLKVLNLWIFYHCDVANYSDPHPAQVIA